MKKIKFSVLSLFVATMVTFVACDPTEVVTPSEPVVGEIGNGDQEFSITSDTTFVKGTYTLKGWVYITDGVTVTIEPGTIIKGDKETQAALIVEPGGKLIAEGTATEPIVFTSNQPIGQRKPGDWGGLVICGKAKNNKTQMQIEGGPRTTHGGTDDADNSGIYRYIRVEFAGYPFQTDQEINAVTLGSVGSGTTIDHIQVSYSNDDSFEWFGGCVNAKYLVAYHGWDDEFDTDNGYTGNLQYLLSIKHPRIADTSYSSGFESDNDAQGSTNTPMTAPTFANVTFVGPISQGVNEMNMFTWTSEKSNTNNSTFITGGDYNPQNGSKLGIFAAAMHIRRNSHMQCYNSVAVGFPVGLILDNDKGDARSYVLTNQTISNNFFGGHGILGTDVYKQYVDSLSENGKMPFSTTPSYSTVYLKANNAYSEITTVASLLSQPNSLLANANYGPKTGSPILNVSPKTLSNSFFDVVDYIGAFKSDAAADNWTTGWCNFDPQNTEY